MRKILGILLVGFLMPGMLASAQWGQKAELTASDQTFFMGWSASVSADGTTVAAGEPFDGAVYVFVRNSSSWASMTQVAKLTASDSTGGDELGLSVSVSADGSTIVADGIIHLSDGTAQGIGYVFVRPSTGWKDATETAKLIASDGEDIDFSASAISADGSTIVASDQGAAYVFTKPPSGWKDVTQSAKLVASNGSQLRPVGISSDGSTVAATGESSVPFQSAVYIFAKPAKGWADETQTAMLSASDSGDTAFGNGFGSSVALSSDGSTVAAAAPEAGIQSFVDYGAIYVFERPKTGWTDETETAKLTASDGTDLYFLGTSMAMSATGSVIAAQVPVDDARYPVDYGYAYIFGEPSGGWKNSNQPQYESAKLTGTASQYYGEAFSFLDSNFSLTADGLTFAVGFPDNGGFDGAAVVFSDAVPFAQFQPRLKRSHSVFALNAGFILSGESDGIDPANEPVTLVIGSQVLAFPAGSFKQNGAGNYVFSGVVDGVSVAAQIKVLGSQMYQFLIEGHKANLAMPTSPVNLTLSIGDDTGTTRVNP